jgi:hypothetical protein
MRQALIQTAGLAARLGLAVFYMGHVAGTLSPGTPAFGVETGTRVLDLAAAGLFALVALWLLLGIFSRVVALIGMTVCGAAIALFEGTALTVAPAAAGVATLVLAFTGGGRMRLHAGGWRMRGTL